MPTNNNNKVIIKKLHDNKITINLNNLLSKQCNNIIKFLGIYKDENKFFLITPLAEGNLRDYLKSKNYSLKEKIKIATDITNGIRVLHEHNIIHENLHPKNILMFDGIANISDLPLPYEKKSIYFDEHYFEKIGYLDPDSLLNEHFEKRKSMDIYSLGSLLWEIMSEQVPYSKDKNIGIVQLIHKIKEGHREDDISKIPDIPAEYIDLYKKCWDKNSLDRPSIEDVYKNFHILNNQL
ncbi:kinase-like domain-containing protein [Glomus cerebriforme]|uniref:Kinase-like domain-containing protein n=1 Tax=Glomus cerebriforme TaxID=658196 RepID=A0A397SK46_9GLOM|nr:kinase-like domain-containing protein [Glomus cerebriforme]